MILGHDAADGRAYEALPRLSRLGSQDLNLNRIVQSDQCCHYTTPQ